MSNPALMMAISGSLHYTPAAASASPVLVQQEVSLGTAAAGTLSLTLASAPVAGNTLVMYKSGSGTGAPAPQTGWTLVANGFAGVSTGSRGIFVRTADGTEGTTITQDTSAGNTGFAVQEWQGSVTVTPAEGGQSTAGSSAFTVGPFAAPSAKAVPAVFGMFNGNSAMPPVAWPAGWTNTGPLANGSFPARGQVLAYGTATASAITAQTLTYTGSRGNGVAVLWVGAWIS
jgi:hypothetical protein